MNQAGKPESEPVQRLNGTIVAENAMNSFEVRGIIVQHPLLLFIWLII